MNCQEYFPKDNLLKFVLNQSASNVNIELDDKQNIPARSMYLCKSTNCLQNVQKKSTQKIIRRHLRINSPQVTDNFIHLVQSVQLKGGDK